MYDGELGTKDSVPPPAPVMPERVSSGRRPSRGNKVHPERVTDEEEVSGAVADAVRRYRGATEEEREDFVKRLALNMNQRRQVRNKLGKLDGGKQRACCGGGCCVRLRRWWREQTSDMELMRHSLKTIEGHYGSSVAAYFRFLRWLLLLNVVIFVVVFVVITLPQVIFTSTVDEAAASNATSCAVQYNVVVHEATAERVLDFFQGTGWMEETLLFYGHYGEGYGDVSGSFRYNFSLAYLLAVLAIFTLSLVLMVRQTSQGFKTYVLQQTSRQEPRFSQLVFAGWDHNLSDTKTTQLKHASLLTTLRSEVADAAHDQRHESRSCCSKCRLYTLRLLVNVLVLALLGGAGYLIYFTTTESLKFTQRADYETINRFVRLLVEYAPSLTISFLNFLLPFIFEKLVLLEGYKPEVELQWTLARTVFLRMASLGVLIATLYSQITCSGADCTTIQCWETYVGQQFYKLVIMNFIVVMAVIAFVDFPRKLITTRCGCRLSRAVGPAEFQLPKNVLDLVYSQTLCWLGALFAPLIPGICLLATFIFFYAKKVTCLYNHVPAARPFRASRTRAFFMLVLLAAFLLTCVPLGYVIWVLEPSCECGPFRSHTTMWSVVPAAVSAWPAALQTALTFLTSAGVVLPCFALLVMLVYFCSSLSNAHKASAALLHDQLMRESREKQQLLAKIHAQS